MKKIILGFILISVAVFSMALKDSSQVVYEIGEQVDDFKLQSVDQSWISLSDYMGEQGTILIFTCNTCQYAQMYEDRIIAMHERFSKKGFPVLAINPNDVIQKPGDSFENMKKRSEQKGFTFPYLLDVDQEVYPRFGATNTPQVFLLGSDMRLRYSGAIDDNPQDAAAVKMNYVENAVQALMADENPEPSRTKAIGCGIKAKKKEG
jgi:peroxiredoxin